MIRVEGWEGRLAQVVEVWRARPFAWGGADCLAFARACQIALLRRDLFMDLPTYSSRKEASAALKALGLRPAVSAIDARLPSQAITLARRGDWILYQRRVGGFGALGVVMGRASLVMGPDGLVSVPTREAKTAWAVG